MAEGDLGLLERMRRTRSGWGEDDLSRLYRSFGFREITRPVHLIVFMSTLITLTYEPRSPERSHSPKAMRLQLCGSLGFVEVVCMPADESAGSADGSVLKHALKPASAGLHLLRRMLQHPAP